MIDYELALSLAKKVTECSDDSRKEVTRIALAQTVGFIDASGRYFIKSEFRTNTAKAIEVPTTRRKFVQYQHAKTDKFAYALIEMIKAKMPRHQVEFLEAHEQLFSDGDPFRPF